MIEAREQILSGEREVSTLDQREGRRDQGTDHRARRPGLDDQGLSEHGHFEDMMAIDSKFLQHIESLFPGRDIEAHNDEKLHNHGTSTIKYGRGAVLTVDLTNRCNMMCDPCFMDANQVGFVHELSMEDVSEILDNAIQIKPRRQMSVQYSGGEPTLSPYFLGCGSLCTQGWLQLGAGRDQRYRVRQDQKNFAARPPKPGFALYICSSTVSATMPTRTARSATCST